jgi:hypothetical protein
MYGSKYRSRARTCRLSNVWLVAVPSVQTDRISAPPRAIGAAVANYVSVLERIK